MGYRTRLMRLPKHMWLELKDKTEEELQKQFDDEDFYWRDIPELEELYEVGKAWDFDDETHISRFFTHEMTWEEDTEFSVASKEFLLGIIENYTEKTIKYHRDLFDCVKDVDEQGLREYKLKRVLGEKEYLADGVTTLNDIQTYFRNKIFEWNTIKPYSLDDDTDEVVTSWSYEYVIFELVRILKTFDWENDILIWSGS